jgi:hypothetical protein
MQTDFLSNSILFVSYLISGTFLMHRIRDVLTKRVLKNSLGDQGTWLPVFPRSPKGHLSRSPFITLRASLRLTIYALVALRQASSHPAQRMCVNLRS